jgi:ribosomal protein L32
MALPKRRKSKAKTHTRRTHNDKVFLVKLVPCSHCGYYNDREVIAKEEE